MYVPKTTLAGVRGTNLRRGVNVIEKRDLLLSRNGNQREVIEDKCGMEIILGIVFFISFFLMLGLSLILALDEFGDPTYKARLMFCFIFSTILMVGCFATLLVRWNDDSEYVKSVETSLKKCMERFPEHQDRCVISVTK